MVDSKGEFRYSCFCGQEIKSRSSFNRHIQKCKKYNKEAIKAGYMIGCNLCDFIGLNITNHINKKHKAKITINEYIKKYGEVSSEYYQLISIQKIKDGKTREKQRNFRESKPRSIFSWKRIRR